MIPLAEGPEALGGISDLVKMLGFGGALVVIAAAWFTRVFWPQHIEQQEKQRTAFAEEQAAQRKAHSETVDKMLANDRDEHTKIRDDHNTAIGRLLEDSKENRKEILGEIRRAYTARFERPDSEGRPA